MSISSPPSCAPAAPAPNSNAPPATATSVHIHTRRTLGAPDDRPMLPPPASPGALAPQDGTGGPLPHVVSLHAATSARWAVGEGVGSEPETGGGRCTSGRSPGR